jgi:hypothetical protein
MKRWSNFLLLFGTGALATGCGLVAGFVAFLGEIEQQPPADVAHAHGMIVLTGGADRVADAITLFSRGLADRLLITGVHQAITKSEIIRRNPRARDLIECCVDLGYEAANTTGNAREARVWVEQAKIAASLIVVTSNYHMPRAMAELRHELPGYDLRAYPVVALGMKDIGWWKSAHAVRVLGTEYLKYLIARARLKAFGTFS